MRCRTIALIPAYEPDAKIKDLTKELNDRGFNVVIVDDGSGPDYADLFCTPYRRRAPDTVSRDGTHRRVPSPPRNALCTSADENRPYP